MLTLFTDFVCVLLWWVGASVVWKWLCMGLFEFGVLCAGVYWMLVVCVLVFCLLWVIGFVD